MFIKKITEELYEDIEKTLEFLKLSPFLIVQIRFLKDFGYTEKDENDEEFFQEEDGYIVEYMIPNKIQRIVLGDSEIFHKGEPPSRNYEAHLGKSVVCHQLWSEFPVVYGNLKEPWDEIEDYENGGMYSSQDYFEFESKYN